MMRSVVALMLACVAGPTLAAEAAGDAGEGSEITVTAARQPYRGDFTLQETPAAITTIDGTWLNNNNILPRHRRA